jgi:hypothetical protein
MRSLLVRFLKYLLNLLEQPHPILPRVKELTVWAEGLEVKGQKVSGERKHRQVFLRLVAEFPDVPKREISFLIEKVLNGGL